MSGTKVKKQFTPKSENCRKSMSVPLAACADSDNMIESYSNPPIRGSTSMFSHSGIQRYLDLLPMESM